MKRLLARAAGLRARALPVLPSPSLSSSCFSSSSSAPPGAPPTITVSSSSSSSSSSSPSSPGLHGLSAADTEKHVADLQRKIRALYATEHYESALELVRDLHEICAEFYGEDHPVSASAINNHALLNKSVGQFAEAVDLFTSAIQSYEASVGERHSSTATALHNLGLTYKAMYESDEHTGVDELNLQDRAEEALHESIGRRESRRDPEAATTMYVLAAVKSAQGFRSEAEGLFEESVSVLRETHEEATNPTNAARLATGLNNFGFWLKTGEDISPDGGREEGGEEGEEANDLAVRNTLNLERALDLYTEAFTLRKEVLGESHVSTIVSMQNIAELLHVQGRTDDAAFLQKKIIEMADKSL